MLIIHDCLRILKVLSRANPLEAVYLGMDNLYLMNGQVRLCDPFLTRTRLLQELIKLKAASSSTNSPSSNSDASSQTSRGAAACYDYQVNLQPEKQKLWQVQNLYFIGLLAARLLTLKMETDPIKILMDRKIGQSRLKPIIKTIFTNTSRLMQ